MNVYTLPYYWFNGQTYSLILELSSKKYSVAEYSMGVDQSVRLLKHPCQSICCRSQSVCRETEGQEKVKASAMIFDIVPAHCNLYIPLPVFIN